MPLRAILNRLLFTMVASFAPCMSVLNSDGSEMALQVIHEFFPGSNQPLIPSPVLALGNDGSFYGTSRFGGLSNSGTIFRITPQGAVSTLYSFDGPYRNPDGITQMDGVIYGVVRRLGGPSVIFRFETNGTFTPFFNFGSEGDGSVSPLMATANTLYGTTSTGGSNNLGTVFRITTNGNFTSLVSFSGTNGAAPYSKLVLGPEGDLYGTTEYGGNGFTGGYTGHGTVFKLTTNGSLTSLAFFNGTNGARPSSGLALGRDHCFYGTTRSNGTNGDHGTVFKVTTNGALTMLARFNGENGNFPSSRLTQGIDDRFYGLTAFTFSNSTYGFGTAYCITTNGVLTTIARFNGTNSQNPAAELILAEDGNLYGTALDVQLHRSLSGNYGIFFRLVPRPVVSNLTKSNDMVQLAWTSFSNGTYRIDRTQSLAQPTWTTLSSNITAVSSTTTFTAPANSPAAYYRIVLLP